jgi:hypothetical protein
MAEEYHRYLLDMSASELRTAIIVEHESLMTKYGHWTAVPTVFELDMFCLYDELREKELEKCTIKQLRRVTGAGE